MTSKTWAVCLILASVVAAFSATPAAAGDETAQPCCFTNPRFAGVCEVQPGEDETCASILGYLNNMNSVGKTYCGGTPVRGGWATVSCSAEEGGTESAISTPCSAAHRAQSSSDTGAR